MPGRHAGNDLIDTSYASYARAWLVCLQALRGHLIRSDPCLSQHGDISAFKVPRCRWIA